MVYRRFTRRTGSVRKKKSKLRYIAVIAIIAIILIDITIRPILNRAIAYQSRLITSLVIAEVASKTLADLDVSYQDIVHLSKASDEQVSSIEIDTATVNKIKVSIVASITEKLNKTKNYQYQIPLGTVLGNNYFIDRGPLVNFKITPMGNASAALSSEFLAKGINQTQHTIILTVTVDTTTLIPLHNANSTVTTDFIIAETVIIGKVPTYYSENAGALPQYTLPIS